MPINDNIPPYHWIPPVYTYVSPVTPVASPEEPELRWYWAIFKDVHVISRDLLGGELETQWFDTLGEAQSQFRKFDRDRYRIHGVLRSDDD